MVGAGVGVAAVAAPLYAAELAPAAVRGRFVSCLPARDHHRHFPCLSGRRLAVRRTATWRDDARRRPPCRDLLLFAVALAAPKSPRWLMMMGRRREAAARASKRSAAGDDVEAPLNAIAKVLRQEGGRRLLGRSLSPRMASPADGRARTCDLPADHGHQRDHLLRRPDFRRPPGFTTPAAQTTVTTWAIGGVNVLATLIAIAFIDRLGRRKLLLAGLIGMGVSLIVVGVAFQFIARRRRAALDREPPARAPRASSRCSLWSRFIISFAFSMGRWFGRSSTKSSPAASAAAPSPSARRSTGGRRSLSASSSFRWSARSAVR